MLIIGTSLPTPLYASYERAFGMSALGITLTVAVYAAAVIASLLVCGPLSDAYGYRIVLVCAFIVAVGGAVLLAAAGGPGSSPAARRRACQWERPPGR